MSVIQRQQDVAAGEVVDNLLSGSAFEFIRARAVVQMAVVASDADSFITIQIGSRVLAEEFVPKLSTVYPVIPDDFYYAGGALSGDRLVVRARNADASATITFRIIVQITEV